MANLVKLTRQLYKGFDEDRNEHHWHLVGIFDDGSVQELDAYFRLGTPIPREGWTLFPDKKCRCCKDGKAVGYFVYSIAGHFELDLCEKCNSHHPRSSMRSGDTAGMIRIDVHCDVHPQ